MLHKILSTLQCGCEEAPCSREEATVVETRPNIFKKKVFTDKKNLKVNFKSDAEDDRHDDLKSQAEREKNIDKQIQDLQAKNDTKFSCNKFLCCDGNNTIDETDRENTQNYQPSPGLEEPQKIQ